MMPCTGVRAATPEELTRARDLMRQGEPLRAKMEATRGAERDEWQAELEMLERATDETVDLPLEKDGSRTLRIRRLLSEPETRELNRHRRMMIRAGERTQKAILEGKEPDPADLDVQEEAAHGIIALVTVNPLITVSWLKKNRDQLASRDLGAVIADNYISMTREMEEVVAAAKFREEPGRAGIRRSAAGTRKDSGGVRTPEP